MLESCRGSGLLTGYNYQQKTKHCSISTRIVKYWAGKYFKIDK